MDRVYGNATSNSVPISHIQSLSTLSTLLLYLYGGEFGAYDRGKFFTLTHVCLLCDVFSSHDVLREVIAQGQISSRSKDDMDSRFLNNLQGDNIVSLLPNQVDVEKVRRILLTFMDDERMKSHINELLKSPDSRVFSVIVAFHHSGYVGCVDRFYYILPTAVSRDIEVVNGRICDIFKGPSVSWGRSYMFYNAIYKLHKGNSTSFSHQAVTIYIRQINIRTIGEQLPQDLKDFVRRSIKSGHDQDVFSKTEDFHRVLYRRMRLSIPNDVDGPLISFFPSIYLIQLFH